MYEYLMQKKVIEDLKVLVKKVENYEKDSDVYCQFMRDLIINSYSEN